MSNSRLTAADRQRFSRARERGHRYATRATAVVRARYEVTGHLLKLTARNGKVRFVPRQLAHELDGVPAVILRSVAVSPARDAISSRAPEFAPCMSGTRNRDTKARPRLLTSGTQTP